MKKIILVGTGTNAVHAYDFIKCYDLYDVIGFAVNEEYKTAETFLDLPVYSIEELDNIIDKNEISLFIAVLWNNLNADRRKLFEELKARGFHMVNLVSPKSALRYSLDNVENCWVHDFTAIHANGKIGNNVVMMAYSLVGCGSVVEDHCFLGGKSSLAGEVRIGEQTFIGMNCTVFDGTTVGKKCILGACTAVKRNVPDYSIYKSSSDIQIIQSTESEIEKKLQFRKNVR